MTETEKNLTHLFFWSDTEILKTKTDQDDIDSMIRDIWNTYFGSSDKQVDWDQKAFAIVSERFNKGPHTKDLYDPLASKVYQQALITGDIAARVKLFATAAVYKKRVSKLSADLPDALFDQVIALEQDNHWEKLHTGKKNGYVASKNVDPSLQHYHGVNFKETINIHCETDAVVRALFDKSHEWAKIETKILEVLSDDRTFVQQSVSKTMAGPMEWVYLRGKRRMPDGTVCVLTTSIDHTAPPEGKATRGNLTLGATFAKSTGPNTHQVTSWYMAEFKGSLINLIVSYDWTLIKTMSRVKNLKKFLEESKSKKDH